MSKETNLPSILRAHILVTTASRPRCS